MKLGKRNDVEGRIYRILSPGECAQRNIKLPPEITPIIRIHPVLVLDWSRTLRGHVEAMIITSNNTIGRFLPIEPTRKAPYPIQLKLRHVTTEVASWGVMYHHVQLPKWSYVKIDTSYMISIEALQAMIDGEEPVMLNADSNRKFQNRIRSSRIAASTLAQIEAGLQQVQIS